MNKALAIFTLVGYIFTTAFVFAVAFINIEAVLIENAFFALSLFLIVNVISFSIPVHYFMKYKSKYFELKDEVKGGV